MALDRIVTRDGDTVDAAIWRERGLGPDDLATVLDLNPGLAGRGVVLTADVEILVPPPAARAAPTRPLIQLWD